MKPELKFLIGAHLALFAFLLYQSFDLITLLNDDSARDLLSPLDLLPTNASLIPKIIHQTYKTNAIPAKWQRGQQACVDLHPDYQYILWTDHSARQFIQSHYSWFLPVWDRYPYPIERADAIRYFVLDHYGGIYIDLDDGCNRKLDPLLALRAFVRKTSPTGISNDVLGAVPGHPFFKMAIANLAAYQRNWLVPYITIMISTGPLFLSVMWRRYKRWGVPLADRLRILLLDDYKGHADSFFSIAEGNSWHRQDANFIKGLGAHLPLAVLGGFFIGFSVLGLEYLLYLYLCLASCKKAARKAGAAFSAACAPLVPWVCHHSAASSSSSESPIPPCPSFSSPSHPLLPSLPASDPYAAHANQGLLAQWRSRLLRFNKRRSRKDSNVDWSARVLDHGSDTDLDSEKAPSSKLALSPYFADSDDSDLGLDHSPHRVDVSALV